VLRDPFGAIDESDVEKGTKSDESSDEELFDAKHGSPAKSKKQKFGDNEDWERTAGAIAKNLRSKSPSSNLNHLKWVEAASLGLNNCVLLINGGLIELRQFQLRAYKCKC
jgi:DNA-binding transcriptional ArsR family regulator